MFITNCSTAIRTKSFLSLDAFNVYIKNRRKGIETINKNETRARINADPVFVEQLEHEGGLYDEH
jgi:hypothetical protein